MVDNLFEKVMGDLPCGNTDYMQMAFAKTVYNESDLKPGGGNSQNGGYFRHGLCYSRFRWVIEIVMCSLPYIQF